jgi:hypothetical protein
MVGERLNATHAWYCKVLWSCVAQMHLEIINWNFWCMEMPKTHTYSRLLKETTFASITKKGCMEKYIDFFKNCSTSTLFQYFLLSWKTEDYHRKQCYCQTLPLYIQDSILTSDNGIIIVKFLPPGVTAIIQPTNQEITVSMKLCYHADLLRTTTNEDISIIALWEKWSCWMLYSDSILDAQTLQWVVQQKTIT